MLERLFPKLIKISYGLTVCNEAVELERLLLFLLQHKNWHDEILVLQDVTTEDPRITALLGRYRNRLTVERGRLNGDFAHFKNRLTELATGKYLFQIDADELPTEALIKKLKKTLMTYRKVDCFAVPRVNVVDGITPELIKQWNWKIDAAGRINFPDYQLRIFRLNRGIHWKNKVHEELTGHQQCHFLPADTDDWYLMHRKNIDRQKRQNELYDSL